MHPALLSLAKPRRGSPQAAGRTVPPQRKRKRTNDPKPSRASPNDLIAPRVNTMPTSLSRRLQGDPTPWHRPTGAPVWLTPRCTFARMKAVTIEAGWGWATCVPMAIPVAAPGASFTVRHAAAIFGNHGTLFHGKRASVDLIVRVIACLAEGLGIRATARVFEVDPNTVLQWLVEAAEQLQAFTHYFLCDVHGTQLQLDELYAVIRDLKAGEMSEDDAIERLEGACPWVWTAIDPVSKLLLAIEWGHGPWRWPSRWCTKSLAC